ncbi:MAG: hypothetical protein WC536_04980 [Patescibacteria group bacterium]
MVESFIREFCPDNWSKHIRVAAALFLIAVTLYGAGLGWFEDIPNHPDPGCVTPCLIWAAAVMAVLAAVVAIGGAVIGAKKEKKQRPLVRSHTLDPSGDRSERIAS